LWLAFSTGAVMAALGQAPCVPAAAAAPVQVPAVKLLAAKPVAQNTNYTTQELQLDSGTLVREYATPAGVVFAVTWRGPVLPDLSALLGNYFSTFKQETDQARTAGKRGAPVNLMRGDLVVRSNGRMRNFFGHAYVPSLIPPGVLINDLLP
jgi:hypothetical protein